MKICKYCATKTGDEAKKCPGCGAEEFYRLAEDDSTNMKTQPGPNLIKVLKLAPRKIKIAVIIGCVLLALLTALNIYQYVHPDPGPVIDEQPIQLGFKNIGELATQVAYYTEIVSEKDYRTFFGTNWNVPGTKYHVIVSFNGVIKAGLDFEKIEYKLDDEAKLVTINLPEIEILSNAIDHDSMTVWYEQLNVFNPSSIEKSNELFVKLEESGEKHAIENGLLDNALLNAETIIVNICEAQLPDYTVEFKGGSTN